MEVPHLTIFGRLFTILVRFLVVVVVVAILCMLSTHPIYLQLNTIQLFNQEKSNPDDTYHQHDLHHDVDSKQRHISPAPIQLSRDPGFSGGSDWNSACHFQLVYQSYCIQFTQHSI